MCTENFHFHKKVTNFGKSLVASSLTCPLKIPCQRNGHQSLHSGFNIDCLGEKVLRLRLVCGKQHELQKQHELERRARR